MILRAGHISFVAAGFVFDVTTSRFLAAIGLRARRRRLPQRTRRRLERLGPTFVKLGQALSERHDLLPDRWTASLAQLQSGVAPFDGARAANLIEQALGCAISDLFAEFDPEPMAAGSVAQVHTACLKDGREVIVKVLRPRVSERIARDMRILLALAKMAQPLSRSLRRHRIIELARELARSLRRETDLHQEARNIRLFERAFADSDTIFIPGVVDDFSSGRVITQMRSGGEPVDSPGMGDRADEVIETLIDFYLQQFFVIGTFHADPHPGNLFVMPDGRLCVHDFGSIGRLDAGTRESLLGFVGAFVHADPEWLADAAVDIGLVSSLVDRRALCRAIDAIMADLKGSQIADWSLAGTMIEISRRSADKAARLPPHLAGLVRTVFTIEGTLRKLDPSIDLLTLVRSSGGRFLGEGTAPREEGFAGGRLEWELARLGRSAPALAANWLSRLSLASVAGEEDADRSPSRAQTSSMGTGRNISLGLVAGGLYVAAAILTNGQHGPRIIGEVPLLPAIGFAMAVLLTVWLLFRSD
jgi:ubiquinone biosynthesis protein